MARPLIYLVDGSGYIYRAFYAIRPLSTRDGTPTNAVVGFARMLSKLLRQELPHRLAMTFDPRGKTFRHQMYDAYKATRQATPEDLIPQFALIHELVAALDIPILMAPGFEADDALATLCHQALERNFDVVIVSADKDLMQLVNPHVTIFDPMKNRYFKSLEVEAKFGVPPHHVVDVLALAGDSSDNIPGVPKVGPKSAAKLVSAHGDVEQIIAALKTKEKLKAFERSVLENIDSARLSKRLVTLAVDAPLELHPDDLIYNAPNPLHLEPFLQRIEAHGLLREFVGATSTPRLAATSTTNPAAPVPTTIPIQIELPFDIPQATQKGADAPKGDLLKTPQSLRTLIDNAAGNVALWVESDGITAAVGWVANTTAVAVFACSELPQALAGTDTRIIGYDLKSICRLGKSTSLLQGPFDDLLLAAYVLDPARASFSLENLCQMHLGRQLMPTAELRGTGRNKKSILEIEPTKLHRYCTERAQAIFDLHLPVLKALREAQLDALYRDVELPLVRVLTDMELMGIGVDTQHLTTLDHELTQRLQQVTARAQQLAGEQVNLASPKQLGQLLFETLGYPVIKKTKTGYATDHEVLTTLAKDYELPAVILQHRELSKLKSTYVDALLKRATVDDPRVHTTFNQTGAETGRLSSVAPNLQNIPIRTQDGRRIRQAFIPRPGWTLLSADYSQIELRIMAHMCGDTLFCNAFMLGEDIHERTAREIFTGGQDPDPETRRRAKTINFGILYGLSEFGLSKQLGISRLAAREYIAKYFSRYPKIRTFFDATIEQTKRTGFVTTLTGRRRFVPNINSRNRTLQQAAERIAMNTPIQGSAADLIKMAMLRVHRSFAQHRLRSQLLLQVHDELVVEAPQTEVDQVTHILREQMTQVMQLNIPLTVEVGIGQTWEQAH